jgi:hypothetical protein
VSFDNGAARKQLITVLREEHHALLLVGSGSSRFVGYPGWHELVEALRKQVIPELAFPADLDLLQKANFIRTELETFDDRTDRQRQYRGYLEATFRPHNSAPNHTAFHRILVQLPFCGIATTNYDAVIESAVSSLRFEKGLDSNCHSIDLCTRKPHRVFEFLRCLSTKEDVSSVLHIHGYWENADELILTQDDYSKRYGLQVSQPTETGVGGRARDLDTLHRKVVWALLAMRPVVFVGFSLEDPAFKLMLSFVHEDFDLPPDPPAHIALLPSRGNLDGQDERDAKALGRRGVLPVFYEVSRDTTGKDDHSALQTLVEELGLELGIVGSQPDLPSITRRMLER